MPTSLDRDAYNEYMRTYMLRRYHRRRTDAIALLGGRCVVCGSTDRLELDHIDRATKTFDLGKALAGWSWKRLLPELAKCQVLCHDHHQAKTSMEQSVEHGGGKSGKRNCPCEKCKNKRREYTAAWRAKNGRKKASLV